MGTPNLKTLSRIFKEYLIISIGIALYAFAWVGIIMPAKGMGGGASGLSLLIYYATGGVDGGGIPIGISYLVINVILLIAAVITLGARFGAKTIYAIAFISLIMSIFQKIIPPDLMGLQDDKLLSAVLGGGLSGVGVGICLLQGGSTGGSDIIAMIINKYRNVSYSKVVVAFDMLVIGCSYFVFKDMPTIIYGFIVTVTFGYATDLLLSGNKQSLQLFVMSNQYDKIADEVTLKLHRGATVLDGTGWYTKRPVKVLMIICRKTEVSQMMRTIKAVDPEAFISMGSIMGVYGRGFESYKK